ncbi:amino acid ABC transporter permease [Terrihabitans sp. B22-R8]|uniref:amino acid ABC transporter permease n=1 Tax=Terrihabitans sp. B22-R8 TaxID=3425128 RepID=UPI00403CD6FF
MVAYSFTDILFNLLAATRWTLVLFLVCLLGGSALGMVVLFLRISRHPGLRNGARAYIEFLQGTPLLMQLFVVFFGLAQVGLRLPAWAAAGFALTLWASAFLAEIWRGCVESINRGQWDASAGLGMSRFEQMRHVILPQAVRIAIPPTVGFTVQILKSTSLTSIIGFVELAQAGNNIANATFKPFTVYGMVAIIYFCMCWPISKASRLLERRLYGNHRDY